ncbi:MAG: hypothetical protein PHV34_04140 [Verrucomicrobiae bacterium]|nr:hypothetical protein [Verrucomicrobiae bacterium]
MPEMQKQQSLSEAERLIRAHEWTSALEILRKMEKEGAGELDIFTGIGACLLSLGKASESISYFERALLIQPQSPDLLNSLGVACYASGKMSGAAAAWKKVLSIQPGNPTALQNLEKMGGLQQGNFSLEKGPVLYAFYDLELAPVTYDMIIFLVLAELARIEAGCKLMHVVVVPGTCDGFRPNHLLNYKKTGATGYLPDNLRWRLWNIVVPSCGLLAACSSVSVCASRAEAASLKKALCGRVFPNNYQVEMPLTQYTYLYIAEAVFQGKKIPSLQASPCALAFAKDWIRARAGNRKVITITLREAPYEKQRNSNINAWVQFAKSLDREQYFPVFIRDLDVSVQGCPPELNGMVFCEEAVWDMEFRMALYEASYLNMGINNGPMALCYFNSRCRYLVFKIITECGGAASVEYLRSIQMIPGADFKHAFPFQRLVWKEDAFDVIKEAFMEMVKTLPEQ